MAAAAVFVIWRENRKTWELWGLADTQWRFAGMSGVRTGLDMAGVAVVAQALGMTLGRQLMLDLKTMERAALAAWADKHKRRPRTTGVRTPKTTGRR